MTFLDIMFVELSKFSSGISDFFPLAYVRSFCRLTGRSGEKFFSSCQTIFSIIRMLLSDLSLREPARVSLLFRLPSLICGVFKHWNCLRFLFFTILRIEYRLIPVCSAVFLGAKWIWGHSSCVQTNSSIKSMFPSVETVLGHHEPCLISIEPASLNFFNRHLTEE